MLVTVKELKPYHLRVEADYVHIILAYQCFDVCIDGNEYKFVPHKAKEIQVNRRTKKIENMNDTFAFQREKDTITISMKDLVFVPEFLIQLHTIIGPYYLTEMDETMKTNDISVIIDELEHENVRRLIDKALDERDEKTFYTLIKLL